MNAHEYLSKDGQVVLTLCCSIALQASPAQEGLEPFTLSEWNQLEKQIRASSFKQPSGVQGRTAEELRKELNVCIEEAERIARLLDRSGRLSLELENLFFKGLWVITRLDEHYPARLREILKHQAPTVLYGAGNIKLLQQPGIAVVGSRNIDETGAAFAREIGRKAAAAGLPLVSGGARGTDRLAMEEAIGCSGIVFGALADSLERTVQQPDLRQLLLDDQLVLLTPYSPTAGFSVGAAMGRNKLIYGLAEYAVVVSSDLKTGGTWAGAVEALKGEWCPVFVREAAAAPAGNQGLIKLGALPFPSSELSAISDLPAWLRSHAPLRPAETDLFGMVLREGADPQ